MCDRLSHLYLEPVTYTTGQQAQGSFCLWEYKCAPAGPAFSIGSEKAPYRLSCHPSSALRDILCLLALKDARLLSSSLSFTLQPCLLKQSPTSSPLIPDATSKAFMGTASLPLAVVSWNPSSTQLSEDGLLSAPAHHPPWRLFTA